MAGNTPKREYSHEENDEALRESIRKFAYDKIADMARKGNPVKADRHETVKKVKEDFLATLSEEEQEEKKIMLNRYFGEVEYDAVRSVMLDTKKRLDGRGLTDIRNIWCETDYLPSTHGSALFTRGETQALSTVTLGTKLDEQIIDGAVIFGTNKFLLHYNFPSFSTGEVKPNRGLGRREVGHGNLAMRSLKVVMPGDEDNFPYVVRVVSDILESNGSSSMATVCAGTLALMDAGVKNTQACFRYCHGFDY
jgi:polyribonucleotide nucleotidyltransferase